MPRCFSMYGENIYLVADGRRTVVNGALLMTTALNAAVIRACCLLSLSLSVCVVFCAFSQERVEIERLSEG